MRVTESMSYRNLLDSVGSLNETIEAMSRQVSSGKKLARLEDSPSGSAEMVQLRDQLGRIDQYRTNSDSGSFFLGVTDSSLNSLYNLVTTIFERGSEAANSFNDSGVLSTLAGDIRSLRDQILSLANTRVRGRYIFSGSMVATASFTLTGDSAAYQGDGEVNRIRIGDGLEVAANVPGSEVFSNVFSSIESLLAAVEAGDGEGIQASLDGFDETMDGIGIARTRLGLDLQKLQNAAGEQDTRETDLRTRQSRVEGADLAEAITTLNQAQNALRAAFTTGSIIGRSSLFDYLG